MSARSTARGVLCGAAAVLMLGGCGVGAGEAPDEGVRLSVTRDFGARVVLARPQAEVRGADDVMRVTQRNATVGTRFGGEFVHSIDGVRGGNSGGRPVDWFIYVNGIQSDRGAGAVGVRGGDRLWWDHHDWGVTPDIPAVVGSFPEPFLHGAGGRRPAVRVQCADPRAAACAEVGKRLGGLGLEGIAPTRLGARGADGALRVLVGPWSALRGRGAEARDIAAGPRASGVYARFEDAGARLVVLDARGRAARELGAGSGLVAATRIGDGQPVWFVTGTDAAGVTRAARALEEGRLKDRFALAVAPPDEAVGVPSPPVEQGSGA